MFHPPKDNQQQLFFILGPCAFEGRQHCLDMASEVANLAARLERQVVFKTSFDKANRTNLASWRGAGMEPALAALSEVREKIGLPVVTDVHEAWQCDLVAKSVDILQIPAFLCRQTDLLVAAGKTGRVVHVKKGQFLSPREMAWVVEKVRSAGGIPIACERGTFFGYNALVNDFAGIRVMSEHARVPVVYDATHSVQAPGLLEGRSGGNRAAVLDLAKAAVAVGVAGIFIETHKDPSRAPSDGATMIPFHEIEAMLNELVELDDLVKRQIARKAGR